MRSPTLKRRSLRASLALPALVTTIVIAAPASSSLAATPTTAAAISQSEATTALRPTLPQATPAETALARDATCLQGEITEPWRVKDAWSGVYIYRNLNGGTADTTDRYDHPLPGQTCLHRRVGNGGTPYTNTGYYTVVLGPDGWGWIHRDSIYNVS
jgi:hypothetical protein